MIIFHEKGGEVYGFSPSERQSLSERLRMETTIDFFPNGFEVWQNDQYIGDIYVAYNGYTFREHPTIKWREQWQDGSINLVAIHSPNWPCTIQPKYVAKWDGGEIEFSSQTLEGCIKKVRNNIKPVSWNAISIGGFEDGTVKVWIKITQNCHGF